MTAGTVGHYAPDNVTLATLWYNSGYTDANCPRVVDLQSSALNWPTTTAYHITGPNSNTFAYDMAVDGDFDVPTPPLSPGW